MYILMETLEILVNKSTKMTNVRYDVTQPLSSPFCHPYRRIHPPPVRHSKPPQAYLSISLPASFRSSLNLTDNINERKKKTRNERKKELVEEKYAQSKVFQRLLIVCFLTFAFAPHI